MLVIRLRRIGRKHDPHYRIVVAEHTWPVQGKFLAEVGHYHPKSKEIGLKQDQFLGWIEQGAKPSNTVSRLAEKSGVSHEHITVKEFTGKPKKKAQERSATQAESSQKSQLDKPATEATETDPTASEATTEESSESENQGDKATE